MLFYLLEPEVFNLLFIDISSDQDEEWIPTSAASFLSVVHHLNVGKNNSVPSSRKNSFGSLASAAAATGSVTKTDQDARKQALLDCLKTVNSEEVMHFCYFYSKCPN